MEKGAVRARLPGITKDLAEDLRREAVERLALQGRENRPEGAITAVVAENEKGVTITLAGTGDDFAERELAGERHRAVLEPAVSGAGGRVIAALRGMFRG